MAWRTRTAQFSRVSRYHTSPWLSQSYGAVPTRGFSASAFARQPALVLAEHDNKTLNEGTLPTITAAISAAGDGVTVLVAGADCKAVADKVASIKGVKEVLLAQNEAFKHSLPENVTPLLKQVHEQGKYSHIVAPASTFGKGILPRLAGILDVAVLSDVVAVDGPDSFKRYIYAGNAISAVKSEDNVKLLTVRPTAFEKAATSDNKAEIKEVSAEKPDAGVSSWVSEDVKKSERPDLTSASVVVSGGRALKSKENFAIVEKLADALGGAVGASRAAVDAGYAPNEMQVGQTGKVVVPEMYVAVGISGQIQHLAGMKDSKVIVAINSAEDAPIFQVADYGLVQDLFTAVPELTQKVEDAKKK
eukprot:TRINITY_DN705_c0_g1_i1.p1 TRINITY_DN705_c0_g1~~TRINITY_DN705_c0_g1_i1.p1  ORF type:complete len:377 (+),score=64.76 TRINITY_DN705_c0_g1_i1:50-1132(+)